MPQPRPLTRSRLTVRRRRARLSGLLTALVAVSALAPGGGPAAAVCWSPPVRSVIAFSWAGAVNLSALGWVWPAESFRLARPFAAPAHEYGAGHRGIDLDLRGGDALRAPADGVVAFSGSVAGRGILTIDHGRGLVTTLEPVVSELTPGMRVARGEHVASLGTGGHAASGAVHFGVRLDGRYINPLLLLGDVPRAVLLPCC